MRRIRLGIIEKHYLIEQLARKFYKLQGYDFPLDKSMQDSTHPHELLCVAMAITAIEEFEIKD